MSDQHWFTVSSQGEAETQVQETSSFVDVSTVIDAFRAGCPWWTIKQERNGLNRRSGSEPSIQTAIALVVGITVNLIMRRMGIMLDRSICSGWSWNDCTLHLLAAQCRWHAYCFARARVLVSRASD